MNLGAYSEELGERFHQDIKEIERYQERWDVNMMADFCWNLKRETEKEVKRKRKPLLRSFCDKRYNKKMSKKDAFSEYGIRNCITVKKQG